METYPVVENLYFPSFYNDEIHSEFNFWSNYKQQPLGFKIGKYYDSDFDDTATIVSSECGSIDSDSISTVLDEYEKQGFSRRALLRASKRKSDESIYGGNQPKKMKFM